MRKFAFPFLIGFIALLLAAMAAFFSITGMANIFPGWSTIVMMSAIEAGKIISVSVLYRMWKELKWLKWLLIPMTAIIMLITSIGVYGHLSSGYEGTASNMRTHESKVRLEDQRKQGVKEKMTTYERAIERKQERARSLMELRAKQEIRLDSLYARNQLRSAKDVQASIAQADKEIGILNAECDSMNSIIDRAMTQISTLDSVMIDQESKVSGGEAATIRFMSRVTGWSTDSTANLFMLMIISVFDPLSILLLVVFNMAMDKVDRKEKEQDEREEDRARDLEPTGTFDEAQKEDHAPTYVEEVVEKQDTIEKSSKLTDEELYTSLLYVLYHNGKLIENDHLDVYDKFIDRVKNSNIVCNEAQIDEFLQKCVDLKVIKIGKKDRIALKNYMDALKTVREGMKK